MTESLDIREIPQILKRAFYECLLAEYPEFAQDLRADPRSCGLAAKDSVLQQFSEVFQVEYASVDVSQSVPLCALSLRERSRKTNKGIFEWACPECNETHETEFILESCLTEIACPSCKQSIQRDNLSREDVAWIVVIEQIRKLRE